MLWNKCSGTCQIFDQVRKMFLSNDNYWCCMTHTSRPICFMMDLFWLNMTHSSSINNFWLRIISSLLHCWHQTINKVPAMKLPEPMPPGIKMPSLYLLTKCQNRRKGIKLFSRLAIMSIKRRQTLWQQDLIRIWEEVDGNFAFDPKRRLK